ncbi:MAG TPA: hypothetical protein EYP05_09435 [Piscirickettsiaceae bacterium]|nr:hypothetical protein [Piscirickettsiaceae bacterium]
MVYPINRLILVNFFAFLFVFFPACAEVNKVIPFQFISKYYPPHDQYLDEIPIFLMTKDERLIQEDVRLKSLIAIYGNKFYSDSSSSQKEKKPNIMPPVAPKKVVMGFFFDRGKKNTLINVNGEFKPLSGLFPGGEIQGVGDYDDVVIINYRGNEYRIEVGKPLPKLR